MKVYKIVTDGSAKATGALMKQVVEKYYLDMAPYAHLSAMQAFDLVKNIPYRPDPICTETLMRPSHTLAMRGTGGDCLDGDTRLLTPEGYVFLSDIKVGSTIMGKNGWVKVLKKFSKGLLSVDKYVLSNGGFFIATPEHRCILEDDSEVRASDLKKSDILYQCNHIPQYGEEKELTDDDCKFIGYYLSDGWIDGSRICISGKDGHPKEEQKIWVKKYAEAQGWKTSWHPRYIRVYTPLKSYIRNFIVKKTAIDKYIDIKSLLKLSISQTNNLIVGLMADSHQPVHKRSGLCFGTISKNLKDVIVLLYRKIGISCTSRLIVNHGGLGTNPIWRIYPRLYSKNSVNVKSTSLQGVKYVYDIETADNGIYLPDADIVVHNCDDKAIAFAAWARLQHIPYRFIAIRRNGRKTLHHVAVELYTHNRWVFCDPTYSFNTFGRNREEAERLVISD